MNPDFPVSMRVCGRILMVIGWGLFALGSPRTADAEPAHHYALNWTTAEGAESCRQADELRGAVAKLVSPELLSEQEGADRIIVGTASHSSSWLAQLSVQDANGTVLGERELKSDASTCSELDDSVALAIALLIDPERAFLAKNEAASPSASPAPPASSVPPAIPVPPVSSAPPPAPSLHTASAAQPYHAPPRRSVKGGGVAIAGVLPDVAFGGQLELWLPLFGADSLRVSAAYFGSQSKRGVLDHPDVQTTLYLGTVRAAYCPLLVASRSNSVFGCAGLESGLMVAHGKGGDYAETPSRLLLALDAALTVDRAVAGPWAVSATIGGAVTPIRPRFSYKTETGALLVHRRGALEGRLEIGLAYRF